MCIYHSIPPYIWPLTATPFSLAVDARGNRALHATRMYIRIYLSIYLYVNIYIISQKQKNKALTLAHAQTILYTSN